MRVIQGYGPEVGKITWQDAMLKIDADVQEDKFICIRHNDENYTLHTKDKLMVVRGEIPTIVCESSYVPNTFLPVCQKVQKDWGMTEFHTYVSMSKKTSTFGRHNDTMDVLIVQAMGKVTYRFDDAIIKLRPGDAVFIPEGEYHDPIVHGPRITLSFS
tara:strand:+ start:22627 stop:23100 length:474 start_codon:yes stop_codon:yes gene_type:complete